MPEMPDFDEIMKMAQNAQAELQKAQDNLDKIEVEGAAGGGMVKIRATAKGRILAVEHRRETACAFRKDDGRGPRRCSDQRRPEQGRLPPRPRKCRRCRAAFRFRPGSSCPSRVRPPFCGMMRVF